MVSLAQVTSHTHWGQNYSPWKFTFIILSCCYDDVSIHAYYSLAELDTVGLKYRFEHDTSQGLNSKYLDSPLYNSQCVCSKGIL